MFTFETTLNYTIFLLPCHLMHVHRQWVSHHLLTVCTEFEYILGQLYLLSLVGIVCKSLWLQFGSSPHKYIFVHDAVLVLVGSDICIFCTTLWWKVIHLVASVIKKQNWWSHTFDDHVKMYHLCTKLLTVDSFTMWLLVSLSGGGVLYWLSVTTFAVFTFYIEIITSYYTLIKTVSTVFSTIE